MERSLPTDAGAPMPRLDLALIQDLRAGLGRPAVLAFLGLELAAGAFIGVRRGGAGLETVGLLWLGLGAVAFLAWWAGRHHGAIERVDPIRYAGPKLVAASIGAVGIGLVTWGLGPAIGVALVIVGSVAWAACAVVGPGPSDRFPAQLLRDPRPFLPLMLLVAVPRALATGPGYAVGALIALPSGIGQQIALLLGFFGPLEAVLRRTDLAAVVTAVVFGLLHVPMNLPQAGGDPWLAGANAVVFQATVGAIACLGYVRHRAAVPLGVVHAMAIA
jgi:Type II CAAX prenyl endopeptidase Rce1-like